MSTAALLPGQAFLPSPEAALVGARPAQAKVGGHQGPLPATTTPHPALNMRGEPKWPSILGWLPNHL